MRLLPAVAIFCILALLAPNGYSQQQRGDIELQFQGSYYTTVGTEFTQGAGNIQAKIGPYITDHLQLGVGPTVTITSMTTQTFDQTTFKWDQASETKVTFGSTIFAVYSFLLRGGKAAPYFGAQYFKSDFSDSNDKGSVGVNAGLKYFFARKTAFDVSGNYLFTLNPEQKGGVLLFAVGLSFLF